MPVRNERIVGGVVGVDLEAILEHVADLAEERAPVENARRRSACLGERPFDEGRVIKVREHPRHRHEVIGGDAKLFGRLAAKPEDRFELVLVLAVRGSEFVERHEHEKGLLSDRGAVEGRKARGVLFILRIARRHKPSPEPSRAARGTAKARTGATPGPPLVALEATRMADEWTAALLLLAVGCSDPGGSAHPPKSGGSGPARGDAGVVVADSG